MQPIPFLSLSPQHDRIRIELEKGFKNVLDRGKFILNGEVEAFEKEYAQYSGVTDCIAVASGLDALTISLKMLGVGVGDEVIVPALTCAPTWMAVSQTGAVLVPVDADADTFTLDTKKIDEVISPKTKVIIAVNLYGRPAALPSICAVAAEKKIFVIEDNAQGHGASINGRLTGSFGSINATSFYPTKNLGALGDGGAITTNDPALANRARSFRNYGTVQRFHHDVVGINSRLDELQAAFLRVKLRYLDEWNEERRSYAHQYRQSLAGVGDLVFPVEATGTYCNYHLLVVCTQHRDPLRKFLLQRGIETDVHYPVPPHSQQAYRLLGFSRGQFPVTEKICETILSLPLWPGMQHQRVDKVVTSVKNFFHR